METVKSAEGKRRGCPFINTSKEYVPPYACMMLVAPPDKRPNINASDANFIRRKAYGSKFFGYSINNEYGVYIDKCDRWGMIQQDAHRFVFNADTTVPPGGTGYCTFGEYPARAELRPGMLPVAASDFHFNYYAAVENSWELQASTSQGAFRFFGKIQERSLGIWVVPNMIENSFYAIAGMFSASGAEVASWSLSGSYSSSIRTELADDYLYRQIFGLPATLPTTQPITCLLPGVYVMVYEGIASALNPAEEDISLPFEVIVDNSLDEQHKQEGFASGVLTKVSNGYSSYWPDKSFRGQLTFEVTDKPVDIQLRQTLSDKVLVSGQWRLYYDIRRADLFTLWYGIPYVYSAWV
jgi:hypothetical protein